MRNFVMTVGLIALCASAPAWAGPYSLGADDPTNAYDAPVPGFVGPAGDGSTGSGNYVNPEFIGWAMAYADYVPAPLGYDYYNIEGADPPREGDWGQPSRALGPVTAYRDDIVSLGDLYDPSEPPPTEWYPEGSPGWLGIDPAGEITLTFDAPAADRVPIRNGVGPDFAVFENAIAEGGGYFFAELAYVEVSSDGVNFVRFESDSLTPEPAMPNGDPLSQYARRLLAIDPTDVHNLAGKHSNGGGDSWGTPFDLEELVDHPDVIAGLVDLQQIKYVKIIDVPGDGSFLDSDGDPIYDPWWTLGSGGFDLEALGVLNEMPDFDLDGDTDGDDLDILRANLGSADLHYDLDNDGDADADDLYYMIANNLQWTNGPESGYGTLAGDFNLDGQVGLGDLTILGTYYGLVGGWAQGNANVDDVVELGDLTILGTYYGLNVYAPDAIPEPTTLSLLAIGMLTLTRRKKTA